jgi:hypothetical protein
MILQYLNNVIGYNNRVNGMDGWGGVRSKSPPPLRNQLRSQPAVYQLHLVQDLSFLTYPSSSIVFPSP